MLRGNPQATACYRITSEELLVRFYSVNRFGVNALTANFTANVYGADTNGCVYMWDFESDGTNDVSGVDLTYVTNTYHSIGTYAVTLSVSN